MTHLVEIIDGSLAVPYKRLSDFLYGFRLPDTNYKYLVNFTQDGDSLEVNFKVFSEDDSLADEGSHDRIDIGMRLAVRVFHTVYKILKDFLDTTLDPVDYVTFGAKNSEPSRVRFYRTLSAQLAKSYNQSSDAVIEEQDTFRDEASRQTIFTVPVFVDAAK